MEPTQSEWNQGVSVTDTNQHYDLDPAVFELFLDPMLKYSSGMYYSNDDSLEQAQLTKLHFVADRIKLNRRKRLLDIGCGWGSLILFMAENYDTRAVGISPAPKQHAYIHNLVRQRRLAELVSTEVGHVEHIDLEPCSFDAVTMLGSIVHMPDLEEIFDKVYAALRPNGMLYVSESCYRNAKLRTMYAGRESAKFVSKSIFGWGDLRPLSDLVRGAEDAGFSVVAVDDLTAHYRRTFEDWIANVERNASQLDAISDGLSDRFIRYMQTVNAGWGFAVKHYALTCTRRR